MALLDLQGLELAERTINSRGGSNGSGNGGGGGGSRASKNCGNDHSSYSLLLC